MPVYTYRREDGTTFDVKQKFSDEPLTVDPATGQSVVRVVQSAGIIFKGSGFYVNDSKGAKSGLNGNGSSKAAATDSSSTGSSDSGSTGSESKTTTSSGSDSAKATTSDSKPANKGSAAS